jgi:hypothetical protein
MMMVPHLGIRHTDIIGGGVNRRRERERQPGKRDKRKNPLRALGTN